MGREPDGDGTALIPRHDVVRLHDALQPATTSRSAADRLFHTEDAGGSTPPSSTVTEVEVDDTPGCGPGGSRFESGRSPHRAAGDLGSARSHTPCTRVRFPLPRLTHGPVATGSDGSPARRRLRVRLPPGPHPRRHADVAQLGEARRSDRRQCRFESDRQYWNAHQLDVAQRERTGFGSRGLEVRALPSRPMRGGGTGTTPGSEPGGPRSNRGLAAIDVPAVVAHLDTLPVSCEGRASFIWREAPRGAPFDSAPLVRSVP